MKLKFGQTDVLKMAYMPWTEDTSYCTVLLTSQAHGQFCYEITGEVTPADTVMKVDFQVDIDGPQVRHRPPTARSGTLCRRAGLGSRRQCREESVRRATRLSYL